MIVQGLASMKESTPFFASSDTEVRSLTNPLASFPLFGETLF